MNLYTEYVRFSDYLIDFERRSSVVLAGKESFYWKDITAEMMSDEESVDDNYLRHRPSYCSEKFHNLIIKLDERAASKGKNHTRFKWQEGSVVEKTAPKNYKPWMIKKDAVTEERSSGLETTTAPTVCTPGGDLASDAELSADCSE